MRNYWKADAFRIVRSRSFWLMSLCSVVIYAAGVFMISGASYDVGDHSMIVVMAQMFASVLGGVAIYNAVYNQDIKAGAMHVAIGRGTSRVRIVVAKCLETIVLSILAGIALYIIFRFLPFAFAIPGSSALNSVYLTASLQCALLVIMYSALSSMVSFARQESVTATVVFVLIATGLVDQLVGLLLSARVVVNIVGDLSGYLPMALANSLGTQLAGGESVSLAAVVVYIGYIAISLAVSSLIFKKKELEF